jgi:hypothetical protein
VASVTAGAIRAMAEMADPEKPNWERIRLDDRTRGELRGVLNHYVCSLLGKKPRMHRYLGLLS